MEPNFNMQNMRDTRTEILDNIRAIRGDTYCDCLSAMVSLLTKADVIQYELVSHSAHPDASKELYELLAITISGAAKRYGIEGDDLRFPELLNHARTVINSIMRAGTLTPEV